MYEWNWIFWFNFSNFLHTESSYVKKLKTNHKNKGSPCLFLKYMAFNIAFRWHKFALICMEKLPYWANSSGILHFFKLKYVPVIGFLKYFECMHYKHKHMDLNHKIWGVTMHLKVGIIYRNGSHIGFNYTPTSVSSILWRRFNILKNL